jgi:hypothetical protein
MMSPNRGWKDIVAGVLFSAIGMAAYVGAQGMEVGTLTEMGPGFFPMAIGCVLAALGVLTTARGLQWRAADVTSEARHSPLPLLLVIAGVLAFYVLVDRAGLVVAITALVVLSSLTRLMRRPLEVLVICVVLSVFSVLVFVDAFLMPFRVFW